MTDNLNDTVKCFCIRVTGLVQGVGFRPFVYRIAMEMKLSGQVENRNDGVLIYINASDGQSQEFVARLKQEAPLASNIDAITTEEIAGRYFNDFSIVKSGNHSEAVTEISPDIAVCGNCLHDMKHQPHRLNYPFINCTHCGPRFTIIKDLPYDREKTTMKDFAMCSICSGEYKDIRDRRFHAQPVACNQCGPAYELMYGSEVLEGWENIVNKISGIIESGELVAIKGLGGFHLACDAFNENAVKKLRTKKHRESKPLAVMFGNINDVKKYALVKQEEENAINSWQRPIVILNEKLPARIPESVSNNLGTVGVMLPYMPIHYLLFEKLKTEAIVLTSGNISDEPVIIENDKALENLSVVTQNILINNRDIYNRADDTVVFISNGKSRSLRRSRGMVPSPIKLGFDAEGIMAVGAELKNTFCIGKSSQAILSQHIGDLKNLETFEFFTESIERFRRMFRFTPVLLAADMHPDYLSAKYAGTQKMPVIFVQHHHAHIASCMAEHHLDERIVGVSLDGTGYGDDGNIWGGEFLMCDLENYQRICHFEYVPVPGGDKVSDEPWRMAVSYLYKTYGRSFLEFGLSFLEQIPKPKIMAVLEAIDKKLNCPYTSSAGRLFDAVAALTGVCLFNSFEAEAPMRLESIIDKEMSDAYPYEINSIVSFEKTISAIVTDLGNGRSKGAISARFHNTLVHVITDVLCSARNKSGINKIALSGGVFQNRYLLEKTEEALKIANFEVYSHTVVPSNDGGIALGQLAIAAKRRAMGHM